jgi:hypothetical protein
VLVNGFVMAGHSALKTRVKALMSRPSTSCLLQKIETWMRHEAGHDESKSNASRLLQERAGRWREWVAFDVTQQSPLRFRGHRGCVILLNGNTQSRS